PRSPPVRFDDTPDDVEAEAGARPSLPWPAIDRGAPVAVEDIGQKVCGDALPRVRHRETRLLPSQVHGDGHGPALARELDRISHQVREYLEDPPWITQYLEPHRLCR